MNTETDNTESMTLYGKVLEKSNGTGAVHLRLKEEAVLPLVAEVLSPDVTGRLSRDEILRLPVSRGNRQYQLSDFFEIEGERSTHLEFQGNLANVDLIGRGMTKGSIMIHGNAGMHLGASMSGGSIKVRGDVGNWLGAEMSGGLIRVHGNAGGQVGAAYRGNRKGMNGGSIQIDGAAGIEVGMRMRCGLICIRGPVGDCAGCQMQGGTLILCSTAGIRTGTRMSRGRIIALEPLKILPTFNYDCAYRSDSLHSFIKQLHDWSGNDMGTSWSHRVKRYTGDASMLGKGEILVCAPAGLQ